MGEAAMLPKLQDEHSRQTSQRLVLKLALRMYVMVVPVAS